MTTAARTRPAIRFRGRSFMALVLAPDPPITDWLTELDAQIQRSPAFFQGRPVVVDLSALPMRKQDLTALIEDLQQRDIRLIGIEGADPSWLGSEAWGRPPMMTGSRPAGMIEVPDGAAAAPAAEARPAASLLLDRPVRSGQSVIFPEGDVTVVGSVASGAEIIAGGSIHVYGTLRGRAIAGSTGNGRARIFCRKLEAELLAIDGLYKTADDMEPKLRGRAVQAWLDGDAMVLAALD
ncbi:septum site-determining protein MinC [Inquilinus sp. Marseille-Q2685]|uniref:septum site-determining protein MinC n=1 Tax=Inquilinus sp. Marseille-Q2685 TaxID=2866581 RepID=UPI0027DF5A18|nr:septum site-determining protein MinC [Inquilinus sp. Marseille-Q2685]